jgi:O-antigen/teichoic acid export membrane protein
MSLAKAETIPLTASAHRSSFFRQSGWLMIANIGGGALMWAVHFLNRSLLPGQYGVFGVFLAFLMLLPNIPLQMVLTQQTARGLANNTERQLSGIIRMFLLSAGVVWLLGSLPILYFQKDILAYLKMPGEATSLWVTFLIVLFALWLPMFWGMLQGQQNFLWLGWTMMTNGMGRVSMAAIAVIALHWEAAGMMTGVLMGYVIAVGFAAWQTRSLWLASPKSFDWSGLLRQVVPLLIAFVGFQILFTADTILVKSYFTAAEEDFYVGAGTLSRALLWLVLPLASVMFPRLVHSAAKSEKSNLMGMVLLGTAVLSILGSLSLSLLGPFVTKLVFTKTVAAKVSSLLPWYSAAMVPLALSNVLLNQLLSRPDSKWMLALFVLIAAVGYLFAITQFHTSLIMVLKVMGIANIVLLAICAVFFRFGKAKADVAL